MTKRHGRRRDGGDSGDLFARRDRAAWASKETVARDKRTARNGEPDIAADLHIGAACGSAHVDISARFCANLRQILVALGRIRIWRDGGDDG